MASFWEWSWRVWLIFALRLLGACLCGACIGFERSKRFKEAGVRTHMIVCCASALLMIVSKYGFTDLVLSDGTLLSGTRGADPARIAAQAVSGIGFLGAGVIFKHGSTVKGLTTAAGVWATAGIGLAIGAGMYVIGAFAALIVAMLQFFTHKFTVGADAYATNILVFTIRDTADLHNLLRENLERWGARIDGYSITRADNGMLQYTLTVRALHPISPVDIDRLLRDNPDVLSASNQPIR